MILTESTKDLEEYWQNGVTNIEIHTAEELIEKDFKDSEEIKDFGVAINFDVKGPLEFDNHLSKEECMLGIWEGKYFEGRLMISWFNIDEATV